MIGGSHYPFSEPYGELWECRTCGQRFLYTYDHDNEIGYVASPATLEPMTPEQVRTYLPRAIAVAQRQLAHFVTQTGTYAEGVVADYQAELTRLTSAA